MAACDDKSGPEQGLSNTFFVGCQGCMFKVKEISPGIYMFVGRDGATTNRAFVWVPDSLIKCGNQMVPPMFEEGTSAKIVGVPGICRGETLVIKLDTANDSPCKSYLSLRYVTETVAIKVGEILQNETPGKTICDIRKDYDTLQIQLKNFEDRIKYIEARIKHMELKELESFFKYHSSESFLARLPYELLKIYIELRKKEIRLCCGDEAPSWGVRGSFRILR
jgi:hypothetical protein